MRSLGLVTAFVFGVVGCKESPAASPPPPTPAPAVAPVRPTRPPASATAEVEITGKVSVPSGLAGAPTVWVLNGECFKPGAKVLGKATVGVNSQFFVEVVVPQGTRLWLCGGLVEAGKPLTAYGVGKGSPFAGEGTGEVGYNAVEVPIVSGAPVDVPGSAAPSISDAGS